METAVQYPVVTFPCPWVADHHPQIMIIREQKEDDSSPGKHNGNQLRIRDLTREEWGSKNEELKHFLEENAGRLHAAHKRQNLNYYWGLLVQGIREVLRD